MNTLKDLLKYISFTKFISDYTEFGVNSGIRARSQGLGTNSKDRQTELRPEEKEGLKLAWKKFVEDGSKVIDAL